MIALIVISALIMYIDENLFPEALRAAEWAAAGFWIANAMAINRKGSKMFPVFWRPRIHRYFKKYGRDMYVTDRPRFKIRYDYFDLITGGLFVASVAIQIVPLTILSIVVMTINFVYTGTKNDNISRAVTAIFAIFVWLSPLKADVSWQLAQVLTILVITGSMLKQVWKYDY